jgi:hypothetical protein
VQGPCPFLKFEKKIFFTKYLLSMPKPFIFGFLYGPYLQHSLSVRRMTRIPGDFESRSICLFCFPNASSTSTQNVVFHIHGIAYFYHLSIVFWRIRSLFQKVLKDMSKIYVEIHNISKFPIMNVQKSTIPSHCCCWWWWRRWEWFCVSAPLMATIPSDPTCAVGLLCFGGSGWGLV